MGLAHRTTKLDEVFLLFDLLCDVHHLGDSFGSSLQEMVVEEGMSATPPKAVANYRYQSLVVLQSESSPTPLLLPA